MMRRTIVDLRGIVVVVGIDLMSCEYGSNPIVGSSGIKK